MGEPDLDWAALARPNQTVVVYMGVSTAGLIAERLTAAGRAGSTPALIVENASRADERRILTTLAGLAARRRGPEGPGAADGRRGHGDGAEVSRPRPPSFEARSPMFNAEPRS
jgi:hypothetical protein